MVDTESSEEEKKKGFLLIISNPIDSSNLHEDYAEKMTELWRDKIGCVLLRGSPCLNVEAEGMIQLLKECANTDGTAFDYVVVVIIATGGLRESERDFTYRPYISGSDNKWILEDDIFSFFDNHKSSWQGKPKFFILGYDRFSEARVEHDIIHVRTDDGSSRNDQSGSADSTTGKRYPSISDFLLVYGSSSILIDNIDEVFSSMWQKHTVLEMLTIVNRSMWSTHSPPNHNENRETEVSAFESSITDTFKLNQINSQNKNSERVHEPKENGNAAADKLLEELMVKYDSSKELNRAELFDCFAALLKSAPPGTTTDQFEMGLRPLQASPDDTRVPLKGRVFIISNDLGHRTATHMEDISMMKKLWVDTLKCHVTSYVNQNAEQMKSCLKDFSKDSSDGYDYAVIVVSSHGSVQNIQPDPESKTKVSRAYALGYNGSFADPKAYVCERDMLSLFCKHDSPWRKKEKIFIFDFCRGRLEDEGAVVKAGPIVEPIKYEINEAILPADITSMVEKSFIIYSTHTRYYAYSNCLTGHIKDVFMNNWKSASVTQMLTRVNEEMRRMKVTIVDDEGKSCDYKTMSVFKSTATRKFYLFDTKMSESPKTS